MWREIKKIIHGNQFFLLTTHINPDGDGIGSCCALIELLRMMGKKARLITDGPVPAKYAFLDFYRCFESFDPQKNYSEAQVLFILDTHRKDRIGSAAQLLNRPELISICIDHHEPTDVFTPHTIIDTNACSAGAMVYTLYKECGFELNERAAAGIYTSVICDTGRFSYSSTNRKAHKIADECIKKGVDPDVMNSRLFQHVSLAEIKMFANALQHMETHLDNKVVIQQIYQQDCHDLGGQDIDIEHLDLEYINDFNKMIEDVECIVLLRELPDSQVRVSLRSNSDLNISSIVAALGGGGHSKAAGVTCRGSLHDVKAEILTLLSVLFEQRKKLDGARVLQKA